MSAQLRGILIGLLLPFAAGVPLVAPFLQFVPDGPFLGTLVRIAENAAPHLIVLSLLPAVALAALGARRLAAACALVSALGLTGLAAQHRVVTEPPLRTAAGAPDLRLLWFNTLFNNRTPPDTILAAIAASDADIVLLAEAGRFEPYLDRVSHIYPNRAGCRETCEVVLLSRHPFALQTVRGPETLWPERVIVAEVVKPGKPPFTVVGLHMIKPWFYGISQKEHMIIRRALRRQDGPLILAGDLNAAPWSRRLRRLRQESGLALPRAMVATWPTAAGPLGVPIDHVLTRGGAAVRSIAPWGAELGSDHRGLIAEIDIVPR